MKNATQIKIPFPKSYKEADAYLAPDKKYEVSEVDIVYRYKSRLKLSELPSITSADMAYEIFYDAWDQDKIGLVEEMHILYLNRSNKPLALFNETKGGITGTIAQPQHIILVGMRLNATGMIICHNHPSAGINPSTQDMALTKKMKFLCSEMDMTLQDSMIVTPEYRRYLSMANNGDLY